MVVFCSRKIGHFIVHIKKRPGVAESLQYFFIFSVYIISIISPPPTKTTAFLLSNTFANN